MDGVRGRGMKGCGMDGTWIGWGTGAGHGGPGAGPVGRDSEELYGEAGPEGAWHGWGGEVKNEDQLFLIEVNLICLI